LPHHSKVEGLSPVTTDGTERGKIVKNGNLVFDVTTRFTDFGVIILSKG
jgi:hypothetical protein